MQTTVCQAPEETLQAMAKFKLDISEQRKSTIVCMIFIYLFIYNYIYPGYPHH
jgi:hypothetical protein